MKQAKKFLFAIDLDGTLLRDSSTNEISERDLKNVRKLVELGHVVCINTGRPWKAAEEIYEKVGLKTVIGNYNGAYIHHPENSSFLPEIAELETNNVAYIINDENIKKLAKNIFVEGPGWVAYEKEDPYMAKLLGFDKFKKQRKGIDFNALPLKPTGALIKIENNESAHTIADYFIRRYCDLAEIAGWVTTSMDKKNDWFLIDIVKKGVSKGSALALAMRFYQIDVHNTIAMGDGQNDIPMFKVAQIPVAMKNASDLVKEHANYVTERTNKDDGVSSFIEKFIENKDNFVEKLQAKKTIFSQ